MTQAAFDVLWALMIEQGYKAACVSGNPYAKHAKKAGENEAICGKKPGKGSTSYKMRNRTGWRVYIDDTAPDCDACRRLIEANISKPG